MIKKRRHYVVDRGRTDGRVRKTQMRTYKRTEQEQEV